MLNGQIFQSGTHGFRFPGMYDCHLIVGPVFSVIEHGTASVCLKSNDGG